MLKLIEKPEVTEFLEKKNAEFILTGEQCKYYDKELEELIKSIILSTTPP